MYVRFVFFIWCYVVGIVMKVKFKVVFELMNRVLGVF